MKKIANFLRPLLFATKIYDGQCYGAGGAFLRTGAPAGRAGSTARYLQDLLDAEECFLEGQREVVAEVGSSASLPGLMASLTEQSAEQGFTQAQHNLGVLYANGRGVLRDDVEAYRWFSIAAAAGHPKAAGNRDLVARRLTPAQRADGDRLAREWGEKFKARKR